MIYNYPFRGRFNVTCPFGRKGNWQCGWHIGVDIVGEDKQVLAIADGTVIGINNHGKAYGNHVTVRHEDNMVSLYAHLASVNVIVGQKVKMGTKIGVMGATGNAAGAHLHLELHINAYRYPQAGSTANDCKWLVDPLGWIEDRIGGEDMPEVKDLQIWRKETGKAVIVKAVNIDGSNYIKLRDLEKLTNLEVSFVDGKVYVG